MVLPLPTAICSDPPKTISTVTANMLLLTLSFVPWSLSSCLIAENGKNRERIKIGRTDISIKKQSEYKNDGKQTIGKRWAKK